MTTTKLATKRKISLIGVVSGNVDFDGSGDVVITTKQDNIAIISGDITNVVGNCLAEKTIAYPEGYNQNNAIVLSVMLELDNSVTIWSFGETFDSGSNVTASISKRVSLRSTDITLAIRQIHMLTNDGNVTTIDNLPAGTWHYKIVLMKI